MLSEIGALRADHELDVVGPIEFKAAVGRLEPMEAPWTTEVIADCGGWTADLNNFVNGGDPSAIAPALARRKGGRVLELDGVSLAVSGIDRVDEGGAADHEARFRHTERRASVMTITIGIDPHKGSHAAVAVDGNEHVLDEIRVRSCSTQTDRLREWADRFEERAWAVESAHGLGYLLSQRLVAVGEPGSMVSPARRCRARRARCSGRTGG